MALPNVPLWFWTEVKALISLSWTMMVLSVFSNLMGPISIMFCGHLGTKQLDGVALANSLIDMSGIAISVGLSTACDTFFSQSFGSPNKKMVGVYLQRSLAIFSLFLFPCWAFQINAESFLILIGQDREIARIAGRYMLIFLPGLLGVFLQNVLLIYLRTQNILWPTTLIGGIGVGVNALSHYLLVYVADMGTDGSAISQVIAFYSIVLGCLIYILGFKKYKTTWGGWTWDAFQEWGVFLKLALGGMIQTLLEMISSEVGTILSGLLGNVELGAQSILIQLDMITVMIPQGVGVAANIRVGQLLGAGDKVQVKRVIQMAYTLVHIVVVVVAIPMVLLRFEIPKIFSSSQAVIDLSSNLILITSLYFLLNGGTVVGGGILRGSGRQVTCACVSLFAYYFVGLPIGIPLMFLSPVRQAGIWWGLTVGVFTQVVTLLVIVTRTDWDNMIQLARKRTRIEDEDVSEGNETSALLCGVEYKKGAQERQISSCDRMSSISDLRQSLLSPQNEPLESRLLFKRIIFILTMVLTLVFGIFIKLNFYFPDLPRNMEILCIPRSNSSLSNLTTAFPFTNVSLPVCNYTMDIVK